MDSKIVIDENGLARKADDVEFAEKIIKLRNQGDSWKVIDELITYWSKTAEDEVEAMTINVSEYRETLTDKKYGMTKGGKNMERRFTISFPRTLMFLIRTMYKTEELPFDNKFFADFARRYPFFKVAQETN